MLEHLFCLPWRCHRPKPSPSPLAQKKGNKAVSKNLFLDPHDIHVHCATMSNFTPAELVHITSFTPAISALSGSSCTPSGTSHLHCKQLKYRPWRQLSFVGVPFLSHMSPIEAKSVASRVAYLCCVFVQFSCKILQMALFVRQWISWSATQHGMLWCHTQRRNVW